jgi:hypothetical protein
LKASCAVFWDHSNVFIPAQKVAAQRDGAVFARDVRIHFDHLYDLATAGRWVNTGVCVGSLKQQPQNFWDRLERVGLSLETFERGATTGREQAVDQALQVHMLRALVDQPPGVAVVLTGDGAGAHKGVGFLADLRRMHARGWGVEVLAWKDACHPALMEWASQEGVFIALDDYYDSVTYVRGFRTAKRPARRPRLPSLMLYTATPSPNDPGEPQIDEVQDFFPHPCNQTLHS